MKKIRRIEVSKSGLPCIWERGGGYTNIGDATIVCDRNGAPKKAMFIRNRGELACKEHALVPVVKGDYVIDVYHDKHSVNYEVSIITGIDTENGNATVESVAFPLTELFNAIQVAVNKSFVYHCKYPMFIKQCFEERDGEQEVVENFEDTIDDDDCIFEAD